MSGSPWSLSSSSTGSPWSANRVGIAAAAITPTGAIPPFGAALDLSTLPIDSDAFAEWARLQAEISRRDDVAMATAQIDPKAHERELEIARNFEQSGLSMTDDSFSDRGDSDEAWYNRAGNSLQTGFRKAGNVLGQGASFILAGPSLNFPEDEGWTYEEYRKAGGTLTETEWDSFSPATQTEIARRAKASGIRTDVSEAPGVKQGLTGLAYGYRGLTTGLDVALSGQRGAVPPGFAQGFRSWFAGDAWHRAWRESEDRTPGNALVDGFLRGGVSEETLEDWRKHNSLYQMSSVGVEIAALWYTDPGVLGVQGAGNFSRVLRNEMPLNEASRTAQAVREATQGREIISVRSAPAKKYASWRANRMLEGRAGVEDYARNTDFATFARLPMFHNRATDGVAAAKALHIAANSDNPELMQMTWGVLNADPRAFAQVDRLKREAPENLLKYDPNASTFLNAIEATKTRAQVLEQELEDLSKVDRKGSAFHRWELDTDIKIREDQLARAEADLRANLEYADWLELLGTQGMTWDGAGKVLDMGDPYHPRVQQVRAPKRELWNDIEERNEARGPLRKIFMSNQFGYTHEVVRWSRNTWMNKAGTISFHDIDSGPRNIDRYFSGLDTTLGYKVDPATQSDIVDRFVKAPTPQEKYRVLYDMEEMHLIPAMAQKLGVDPVTVKTIWDTVNTERGRTYDGVLSGKGRVYSSAPSLGQRVGDEFDTARLVSGPDDQGMVTLELMDGTKRTTVTVHESALQKRVTPEDVTQTVNYYQPADIRRLYYELKRHPEMLATLDKNLTAHGAAHAMALADVITTKFYSLWKPLQLWRPGWPQRVLMDEGLRAAAIFGPMYWVTGEGARALGTGAWNLGLHSAKALTGVPGWVKAKFDLRSHHKWLNDGPLARYQRETPNAVAHDIDATTAPKFPASEFPAVNKSRFDRAAKIGQAYSLRNRSEDAWILTNREYQDQIGNPDWIDSLMGAPKAPQTAAEIEHLRKAQARLDGSARRRLAHEQAVIDMGDPLRRFVDGFHAFRGRAAQNVGDRAKQFEMPYVSDLLTGQQLERGFFVPLPHIQPGINLRRSNPMDFTEHNVQVRNFHYWVEQNAELLSRQGIRTYLDPDGNLGVGLWFGQSSKKGGSARTLASNALRRIAESAPLELDSKTLRMFDLDKSQAYYAMSRDTLSPMQEALYRYFQGRQDKVLDTDLAPAPGVMEGEPIAKPVFHGTTGTLPDELLPRNEVNMATGQMMGPGFYTTVDPELAQAYSWDNLDGMYHLRSSRTGQTYDVFDADQAMTEADLEEFLEFIRQTADTRGGSERIARQAWNNAMNMRDVAYQRHGRKTSMAQGYFQTRIHPSSKKITWANYFEHIDEYSHTNKALTDFMESKGYGALTHRGGNNAGRTHQVYVWFHPEDLEVKPLFIPDGDFTPLERWFADPRSVDMPLVMNQVPESRIVRFGRRNPMLRQLHEVHAKIDALGDLSQKLSHPKYNDLLEQEQTLMRAMGLEYAHNVRPVVRDFDHAYDTSFRTDQTPNAFGQDWYVVKDAGRFNRMVNEAEGLNRDFDWAAAANGDLRAQEKAYLEADRQMNLDDLDLELDNPARGMFERMKRKYGAGHTTIEGADGQQFHLPNFYEGHEGEINRALTSSSKTIDNISDGHGGALQYLRQQAAGHKTYHPPAFNERTVRRGTRENQEAVRYFDMWADMLNDQVGNSPIWRRMLAGHSDQRIVDWLENTPQGNRVRAEIMPDHRSVELWVNEHRAKLEYYLPSKKLQRVLAKRRLTPAELRRGVHNDDMPDVFGPDLELTKRSPWTRLADAMWKNLGTIPIDALSRQPFAKATFDAKVRALVAQTDRKYLDEKAVGRIYAEARRYTLNEVRRTLYDLSDGTNLTDMLRFVAPFWNAQQEALMKWTRIVSDRPETVSRWFVGQRATYRNFVVVDEENNEVQDGTRKGGLFNLGLYQPSDKVIFNIPEWMRETPMGKALGSVGSVRIPIGSANTVLQGDMPLFPSTGPLVTMPVDKFLKIVSDTDGTTRSNDLWYRWMFPIGRPSAGAEGVLEQMFPGWGRRLLDATGPADDLGRANLAWSVGREMILEARREGKPAPTQHEINKAANFLWGLRAFTSWASPVQVEFAPQHQFWLDQAHRYREQYGQDYFDQFLADFGKEAAYYAISSSNSLAHVPPTNQGMEEWAENKDLIQKYPDFGGLIISPEAYTDDYSQDAYRAQFDIQLGPLDSRKLRSIQDPQARINEGERLLGWQEFRKVQAAVDAALMERGLTSLENPAAQDLKLLKSQAMSDLRETYPAWATDFDTFTNDIDSKVKQMEEFAFDRQFDSRPDIAGLRQYLVIRAMATEQLDQAYLAGGSRSLQAEENAALAQWFYDQTGQIVQSNPAFAELYARYLTGDTLMRGSG